MLIIYVFDAACVNFVPYALFRPKMTTKFVFTGLCIFPMLEIIHVSRKTDSPNKIFLKALLCLVHHGEDTHALRPKMTFVPHVLLNGRPLKPDEALTNFKHILCSDYGDPRPDACIDII